MKRLSQFIAFAVLILGALASLFPFFWMILTALKTQDETIMSPYAVFPESPQWQNFGDIFREAPFHLYFLNSLSIAVIVTIMVMLTSVMAGYSFARLSFPGKKVLFFVILSTMMIPFEVTLIPNYLLICEMGLHNTYAVLAIPFLANSFSIFLITQSFRSIPNEYFEAAKVDGASHWRQMWHVAIPMAWPGIVISAVFSFLGSYNALLWPLIVTDDPNLRTIQLGLTIFKSEELTRIDLIMAASFLTILPTIILFFIFQKRFNDRLIGTGLK